jgi:hypothetical protein
MASKDSDDAGSNKGANADSEHDSNECSELDAVCSNIWCVAKDAPVHEQDRQFGGPGHAFVGDLTKIEPLRMLVLP